MRRLSDVIQNNRVFFGPCHDTNLREALRHCAVRLIQGTGTVVRLHHRACPCAHSGHQQLMMESLPTTIARSVGGVAAAVVNLLFGSRGTMADPIAPLLILAGFFYPNSAKNAVS